MQTLPQAAMRHLLSMAERLGPWHYLLLALVAYTLANLFWLIIYRLYLSPVAAFPGPFLAKITNWYEFYHNFIHTGMYYRRIREMHDKYGPVVRVSPEEIHIMDSTAYHKLFVTGSTRKTNSYPTFSNGTGFEDMTAISEDHNAHRRLRSPLDRLFSRQSVLRFESRVVARAERLCDRIAAYRGSGQVVNLTNAISSLTTDVISSIIFEEPSDYLGDDRFNEEWYETLKMGTLSVPLFKRMSWIRGRLLRFLVTRATRWTVWDEKARRQIMLIRKRPSDKAKTRDETTVLEHLVRSELVEKEFGNGGFARLAQLIQQAGAHNVSHTLSTIITHLLLGKEKLDHLRSELDLIWATTKTGDPSWLELERAPYLSGCVNEGLRMAIGGMNRTPRVFPDDDVKICSWVIPKGTPISMSTYWMHNDPDVFPNPESFEPTRWIEAEPDRLKAMQAHFVPFAKGSRACVGQNLVHMQLYHTLARIFRPGAPELTLHDTTLRDIVAVHGLLFPLPPLDSNGVRATIS
ncbi:hypothetical protein L249_0196 [Ophiocordyceps polyrhachis-furcata BCC 54312]|uniref:Cytochrome P450 n=1 Tax=Ophiocordyceps polyrhachis-furcata BCC 54312 TaxID=1330021 RepID=A0A367LF85_9HYPO|nr:hypothetical protein L249_0196 [Ophiocordyceps polyrhachis-furcata BCC 54312]